jgi:nitrogen fixation/metabolism regulation signal transduction histidine kinase
MPAASPAPNNLNEIIREAMVLYEEGHKHIRFAFNPDDKIPTFNLDKEQMKRVMVNLLENAVAAVDAVENIIAAYQVHLSGMRGEDSRSITRINDCRRTLQEINAGDALHQVQMSIAVFAPHSDLLKRRVHQVINETRSWFFLRQD